MRLKRVLYIIVAFVLGVAADETVRYVPTAVSFVQDAMYADADTECPPANHASRGLTREKVYLIVGLVRWSDWRQHYVVKGVDGTDVRCISVPLRSFPERPPWQVTVRSTGAFEWELYF